MRIEKSQSVERMSIQRLKEVIDSCWAKYKVFRIIFVVVFLIFLISVTVISIYTFLVFQPFSLWLTSTLIMIYVAREYRIRPSGFRRRFWWLPLALTTVSMASLSYHNYALGRMDYFVFSIILCLTGFGYLIFLLYVKEKIWVIWGLDGYESGEGSHLTVLTFHFEYGDKSDSLVPGASRFMVWEPERGSDRIYESSSDLLFTVNVLIQVVFGLYSIRTLKGVIDLYSKGDLMENLREWKTPLIWSLKRLLRGVLSCSIYISLFFLFLIKIPPKFS